MFIILATAAVFGWFHGDIKNTGFPNTANELFPKGWKGFWLFLLDLCLLCLWRNRGDQTYGHET